MDDVRGISSFFVIPGAVPATSWRFENGRVSERRESLAQEAPVELVYNRRPHAVMMASPIDLEDFALGFSLSEGIVDRAADLTDLQIVRGVRGISVRMRIGEVHAQRLQGRGRAFEAGSSCGLCGLQSLDALLRPPRRVNAGTVVHPEVITRALAKLEEQQVLQGLTGATHAAAWFDFSGTVTLIREDVGRHNALDKLIGGLAAQRIDLTHGLAIMTSRASYELVIKVAQAGITTLAVISAPTSLAVEIADEAGITLIGFARGERCTVYTRPGRLRQPQYAAA